MSNEEHETEQSKGVLLIGDRVEEPVTLEPDVAQVLTQLLNEAELFANGAVDPNALDDEGNRIGDDMAESLYRFRKAIAGANGHEFGRDEEGNVVIHYPDEDEEA